MPEDSFNRGKKLIELKSAPKPPKGELTQEEWCVQPAFHSLPEFKQAIHYWQQCATVKYDERLNIKAPSRLKNIESEDVVKKRWTRKEITDVFKDLKKQVKQGTKRSGQFLKQLEKKEKKEEKRWKLVQQIKDVEEQMSEELRSSRRFAGKQLLFEPKYMTGSKLGEACPSKNVLIVIEASDKMAAWADECKEECLKLLNTVIQPSECETFNIATFSVAGVNTWCPQFQPKEDPKKGFADSLKWLGKAMNPKAMNSQPFPPDYVGMLNKFTAEGTPLPTHIFLCVSRSPDDTNADIIALIQELRATRQPPLKNSPVLPINVVAFDPQAVGDTVESKFFEDLAGEKGSFMFDTSQEDLQALDKMLKAVGVKKKQLDKLNKKLDKLEDLSERVAEDRKLLQVQIALQKMLESDYEICNWALTNEAPAPGPAI